MDDKVEFIDVGRTDNLWTAVRQMREFADWVGGDLQKAVDQVPTTNPGHGHPIQDEFAILDWLFAKNAPDGYRFVSHEEDNHRFGYERVHLSH